MKRKPYQGVTNVVRFNYDMYLKAAVVLLIVWLVPWPWGLKFWARLGALGAAYFLLASLATSHYIYDLSELYRWEWLKSRFPNPKRLINIHSGFDETTSQLTQIYPHTEIITLDFYDPKKMTEPSIERARRMYPPVQSVPTESDRLPLETDYEKLMCCLLAAHELRTHDQRVAFLSEIRRTLHPEGHFILLEHLRDTPNFLTFGPGFTHFFSREQWLKALEGAGLDIREEFPVTPFLRGFVCRAASS